MKQILVLATLLGLIMLSGCDAKKVQQNNAASKQLDAEMGKINKEAAEKREEEFETDGGLSPDSTQLDAVTESLEEAIENSTGSQAAILQKQADIMKDLQGLMKPYESTFNEFMALGGSDPATMTGVADIDRRVELINKLSVQSAKMDAEIPVLLRGLGRLGGDAATVERQLPLIKKIRATDRALFRDMTLALGIVRAHWDGIEFDAENNMLFGADTPDAVIDQYNTLIGQIQASGQEQGRLQQELIKIEQP